MMTSRTSTRRFSYPLVAALVASGASLTACDVDPIGGGSGGGGEDTQTSVVSTSTGVDTQTSTSTGMGGAGGSGGSNTGGSSAGGGNSVGGGSAVSDAIALYGDEIPDSGTGGSTSVGVGGGPPGFEPDRLYLFVSSAPVACADPFGVDADCAEDVFNATIGLPPEYQAPGTYQLSDPAIISNFSEFGPAGAGECAGGGGSFLDGTVEIVSIDGEQVRIILAGTSPAQLEGQHNVLFCNADPAGESNVIGYYPSELPPPESGSSVVAGGGEEEKFILVFADHGQSCADPFGNQPGPGEMHEEFVVRLPPAYLTPGTYDLDDAGIETDYFTYEENTAASGGGGETLGTLTITQVGADSIALELTDTPYTFANGAAQVPRCGG